MSKKKSNAAPAPAAVIAEKPASFRKYYYILGLLVFFVFANSISNGYNMDDELVTRNHKMTSRGLEAIGDIFTSPYYSDDMGYAYGYRPMVHLSFALEHELFGEKPGVSHFLNVMLYTLSVLFFFKLLLKWTGEKGLMVGLIATLLFALHPVHTEVVASIKNRDEILAFLFVMLAGLSIERFLVRKNLLSVFMVLLFFVCAMLSKKSVFPMAVMLPLINIFLKDIGWKQVVLISALLLLPGAAIGSDFQMPRMLLLLAAGVIIIASGFLFKAYFKEYVAKYVFNFLNLAGLLSLGLTIWAIYTEQILFYLLAMLPLAFQFRQHRQIILCIFVIEGILAYHAFRIFEIKEFTVLLTLYFALEDLIKFRTKNWILWVLLLAALVYDIHLGTNLLFIPAGILLILLLHVRPVVGALLSVLTILLPFVGISSVSVFLILAMAALKLIEIYGKIRLKMLLLVAGSLIMTAFLWKDIAYVWNVKQPAPQLVVTATEVKDIPVKSVFQEGRKLEKIENTLTLPHTPSQTIGTGAATLGEYMRLMVFPAELSFYYGYAKLRTVSLSNPWVWFSILVHLGLIGVAVWQLRKRPLISLGIAWYLVCILLFSNWLELVAGMVGERLAFTASAGFCIFIAALVLWIKPDFSFSRPKMLEWLVIWVLVVLAGRTIARNANWKDPLSLMGNDIAHLQNSSQANNLYALKLMQSSVETPGQTMEQVQEKQRLALKHFDQALYIWPEFLNAAYDKGRAAMALQDTVTAIEGFEQAVAMNNKNFINPYYDLSNLYLQTKQNVKFLNVSKKIFAIDDTPDAYSILARGYFINGYKDSSLLTLEKAIRKYPDNVDFKKNLELIQQTP